MTKPDIKTFIASIEARKFEERIVLLVLLCACIGYAWLLLVSDPFRAEQSQRQLRINALNVEILEEANNFVRIQQNYQEDPSSFVRNRREELQQQTIAVDEELRVLYGQLIQPRQMAEVLTTILQRETTLKLVRLENQPSLVLTSATPGAAVPLVGTTEVDAGNGIQVYRHGLSMVFEGDYVETVRYLRSLEDLDTSFFWQSLNYELSEWPLARITLNIFTLSTQEQWIGV